MLKTKAFSLIEMMFVIIVIAVIAVYAVNMLNKRAQTTLATKTAAQMQQWLQAAQNYYQMNQTWPGGWNDISGVNGKGRFLPDSARCSEILNNGSNNNCNDYGYFHLYASGSDGNGTAYTYSTAPYINLETQVPNEVLGKQIAGMLPNGIYRNDCNSYSSNATGGCVSATAVLPGNLSAPQKYVAGSMCSNLRCYNLREGLGYCFSTTLSITNIPVDETPSSESVYSCSCTENQCQLCSSNDNTCYVYNPVNSVD